MKQILLCAVLILSSCCSEINTDKSSKIQNALDATVQIFMENGGRGSGFHIGNGKIVTAFHVIGDESITPYFRMDDIYIECRLVRWDKNLDLAIIEPLVPVTLPYVKIAKKAPVLGDGCYAIGYHFGHPDLKVANTGNVTQISETLYGNFMFFNAPINRGTSGGPVLNDNLEVIGVNQMIFTNTGDWSGIGMCNNFDDLIGFLEG